MLIIYWISTSLVSFMVFVSAYTYFFHQTTIEGIKALGFPDFFRIQLAVLKIIAGLILLIPKLPLQLKEWAYAGIGLFFITAIVAHIAHKDPFGITVINIIFIALLIASNIYLHKLTNL